MLLKIKMLMQLIFLYIFRFSRVKRFKYSLSIVCILKDEAIYMKEWIEYHRLIGVDHFYIYDHNSSDNIYDVLKSYITLGIVTYKRVNTKYYPQNQCYTNAIFKYRNKNKYLAFIDVDEFICLRNRIIIYWK